MPAQDVKTKGGPVVPTNTQQRPIALTDVALKDGFWVHRQETNATATLSHCEQWMEKLGWLTNFDRVAEGTTEKDRPGWCFSDSEVYKLIEACAWEFGRTGNPTADEAVRRLTTRIGRAQDVDGYLNTAFGHANQPPRYSDLEMGHELYCVGHLLQAAVARLRTTGQDDLTTIARCAADHVCATFGEAGLCGHPEIELGLTEFGRALGENRYIDQAQLFLDRRGHGTLRDIPLGRTYFQDDTPIRTATTWRGHAVRALYLSAAAVDVAVERDDTDLLEAVERQWTNVVARRTYLTGGMGSRHQDEGFGEDWELPPDRAYCETCAGVASVMVSWRLFLATGNVRYADLIERTFYNVVAASPREDGRAFFYANPLQQRVPGTQGDDDAVSPRAESSARSAWFDVSCCPTNVARTLATWHTYVATTGERELTLLQYASAHLDVELGDGRELGLEVTTAYPADGRVSALVTRAPDGPVTLRLRVPPWAQGAILAEGGRDTVVAPGFAVVDRELVAGETIELRLPMTPRFTWPDHRIDAIRGCVAVERGPLVLCAESVDLPTGATLDDVRVNTTVAPTERDGLVTVQAVVDPRPGEQWPYTSEQETPAALDTTELTLIPYHRRAERGPAAMRVWLPVLSTALPPRAKPRGQGTRSR